jgi:hypothetical protein
VIFRIALRSLSAHPIRTAVLAGGFGLGVAVMATLLGVGEVILAQARAPVLRGGGDVLVAGAAGEVGSARYLLANILGKAPLAARVRAAAPSSRGQLYLVRSGRMVAVRAKGGIPSLERALGDPETSPAAAWADTPRDAAWVSPDPGHLLLAMDRFHPMPAVPARAASWAEWLYFNGHAGNVRFYLTFMVGPHRADGRRGAGVRLQLDRQGRRVSYAQGSDIDEERLLAEAPDLTIGASRVRLVGDRYHVTVDLPAQEPGTRSRVTGEIVIDAAAGRSMPPVTIRGAGGWVSGYVVPVMSGALSGALTVDGQRMSLDGGTGYHDHNWGFWEGVTWQWGQAQHGDLSLVYGRVRPPADAADPERVPGFLAALGPDGPLGYASDLTIEESNDPATGRPSRIALHGRGPSLDVRLDLTIEDAVVTAMPQGSFGGGMDFLQMRAAYHVEGRAGDRRLSFDAPGSAETFRGR